MLYMFSRIYNILTNILGESKQGFFDNGTSQYQFNCPECAEENGGVPDGKTNLFLLKIGSLAQFLYILIKKQI